MSTEKELRELENWLALNIKGWHVVYKTDLRMVLPNGKPQYWDHVQFVMWASNWRPTTDANQALEIRDVLRAQGWQWEGETGPDGIERTTFFRGDPGAQVACEYDAVSFGEALCRAAKAAVEQNGREHNFCG